MQVKLVSLALCQVQELAILQPPVDQKAGKPSALRVVAPHSRALVPLALCYPGIRCYYLGIFIELPRFQGLGSSRFLDRTFLLLSFCC